MRAALVTVSMGVMEPLLSKLNTLLQEEYDRLRGVSKQIKFLRDELSAMSVRLQVLADAEDLSDDMKHWRDQIRELAYDIEDCIDAFMARVDREDSAPAGILGLFYKFKKLISRHEIANEIEELKARTVEASERHKRYNSVEISSSSSVYCAVDPRLPALYVEIDQLVGIHGPKKHIIELLERGTKDSSSQRRVTVLSIVGCGGLGKTTLANQVYLNVKGQFSCSAFVSVSQNPDVKKILRDIIKEVNIKDDILDHDEKQLIDKLREHLQDKRYLIVIDDVWDSKPWEIIKLALENKNHGSRIIATTRSTSVASCLSSQGGNVYQMKSLSSKDSKRLLFKRAFGSENLCCTHLGSVPDEILRKCDGLPLAIITISSMLADQHARSEWDRVLNDIGSALAKNPGAENMTTILSMSYFDIPHHLRTCLLYLSVFPEDYRIEKQCLINRWIAEGFIQEDDNGRTKYEIGESYFNDLINRSMIQPIDVMYGQAKACRVHDIILDYIKCISVKENFVNSLDTAQHAYTSRHKVRRLSIQNTNDEHVTLWASQVLCKVRSVTVFGHPVQISLLPFTVLRVLDLGHCRNMEDHHLTSIGKLYHLKYFRLSSSSITKLPEKVGELQYLHTLDVRGTSITELPFTMPKLKQLAHLYVNEAATFRDGMISQMHSLEELSEYRVRSYKQGSSIQEFFKLHKLRKLEIVIRWDIWDFDWADHSDLMTQAEVNHSHVGSLLSSCNLHNLYITDISFWSYPWSLHSWHPAGPSGLRKLCMKGCHIYKVPNWMGSHGNLVVLELEMIICMRPEDVVILGAIPSLIFLKLATAGGTNGKIVIYGNNRFQSLKYFSLHIGFCGTALEFEAGSMPVLEHLKLRFCAHKMECLNGAPDLGIQHLSTLSKIEVEMVGNCSDNSYYDPADDMGNGIIRCLASDINVAVETLPNRPVIKFRTRNDVHCEQFQCWARGYNRKLGGVLTEWFDIWQFEEEQTEQATDGETDQGPI